MFARFMSEHRKLLNKTKAIQEISQAIRNMKKGKAPGPDRLTATYYEHIEYHYKKL